MFYSTYATEATYFLPSVVSATSIPTWITNGSVPVDVIPLAPKTKAELSRERMRSFLVSVRPSDHFLPSPPIRPRPPVLHQMVHRLRCPYRGFAPARRLSP